MFILDRLFSLEIGFHRLFRAEGLHAAEAAGIHTSYAATPTDYERAFKAYPELAPFHGNALPLEPTIQPGQDLEGDILASFRMSKQQWDARKDLDFTFGFRYHPLLKVAPTGPVLDQ